MVKVHLERMNRFTGICYDTFTVPDEKAYSKLAEMLRNFLRTRSDFSNKYLDGCDITYAIDFKTKYLRVVFLSNGEVIETLTLNVKDFRLPQKVGPYSYKSFHEKRMDELRNKCQKNETAPINGEQTTRSIVELRGISPTAKAPCRPQTIKIDPNTLRLYQDKMLKSN